MHKQLIDFDTTSYFSDIILDYLEEHKNLEDYYNLPFKKKSFKELIEKKQFTSSQRSDLKEVLLQQYTNGGIDLNKLDRVKSNIHLLSDENTYTITTGHQLCLLTGPLYFIYKIISTINLCEQLKKDNPAQNFVPVYWMATEDHDFEEVNHFNLFGKKWTWQQEVGGAVGKIPTDSLKALFEELKSVFGDSETGHQLTLLFEQAYLKNKNLTDATRYMVTELFQQYGLICLDADAPSLKAQCKDLFRSEILEQIAYNEVSKTNEKLSEKYKIQVSPREVNLFYLKEGARERLVKNEKSGNFYLADSKEEFTAEELLKEIENSPELFSPNVILRPLYQEIILPNLAYIGGGGEIAYWLQLKALFNRFEVEFPILVLRNSVLWMDKSTVKKLKKNNISNVADVFLPIDEWVRNYTMESSENDLDLTPQENLLTDVFGQLTVKIEEIDKSLVPYAKAEHQKSLKMIKDLKNRLVRAEKKKQETAINQLNAVKSKLFPNGGLQERTDNFSSFYLSMGSSFIDEIKSSLNPYEQKFIVLLDEPL